MNGPNALEVAVTAAQAAIAGVREKH
ncbi:MAG: hypothetical protein JWP41_2650, partial [Ramlibacter sp.]|nr:hypothetical protein [Ramlibacter sp.]